MTFRGDFAVNPIIGSNVKRSVTSCPLAVTDTVTAVCVGVQGRVMGWLESIRITCPVSADVREEPFTNTYIELAVVASSISIMSSLLIWLQLECEDE